jgi:type IV secretory pathway TrbD component
MTSQVIVPHRPGPLVDVPDDEGSVSGEPQGGLIGAPEVVLSAGGAALLAAVLIFGLPGWLSVVAVACLALGLALPAHAALLQALRRRAYRRRRATLGLGTVLDASDPSVRRLVTAYGRLERTAGDGTARDAGHLALLEVAGMLAGGVPDGVQREYVGSRAEAVSALADRVADGRVAPAEAPGGNSLDRIKALLA